MEDIKSILSQSKNKLMELIKGNISPEKINQYIEEFFNCTSTTDDIIDFIRNKFHVEWHPKKNKYLRVENTRFSNEESMQLGYSILESDKENFRTNSVEENPPQEAEQNNKSNSSTEEPIQIENQSKKTTLEFDKESLSGNKPVNENIPEPSDNTGIIKESTDTSPDLHQSPSDNEKPSVEADSPLKEITPDDRFTREDTSLKNNGTPSDEEDIKDQLPQVDNQPQAQCNDTLEKVLDYIEAIYKTVKKLEVDHREIKNQITSIENKLIEENPVQKANNLADDMIRIYASENSKKNVNINPVINDRVIELMKSKFNIQNNNAQAINTALLIALYKSKIGK